MVATKSEKLHECLRSLSYATVSSFEKGLVTRSLRKMLESEAPSRDDELPLLHSHNVLNAYTYLPGASSLEDEDDNNVSECGIRLPALHDFNRQMKRGYAILIWIRALIPTTNNNRRLTTKSATQTLFRLSTSDHRTFLQCTLSHWTFHDEQHASAKLILSIGGTAMAAVLPPGAKLPTEQQQLLPIHVASATLSFSNSDWQLFTISHSNPYLKRPRFTITLSGSVVLDADCPYPAVNQSNNAPSHHYSLKPSSSYASVSTGNMMDMEEVVLFHNLHIPILCGACAVLQEPITSEEPLALLAELGPCTSGSIIAHPPPVPVNRDAATVSVVSSPHCYSLGMTDSLPMETTASAGQNSNKVTSSSNSQTRTAATTTSTNIEYSRIGIPSCKDGNRGAEIVQQLRSKIIYEFHPWDAPHIRSFNSEDAPLSSPSRSKQRTIIPPTFIGAKLGLTENVRLGLVEPNPGSFHVLSTSSPSNSSAITKRRHAAATLSGLVVLGTGSVISNSDWLLKCQKPDYSPPFDPILSGVNIVRTHIAVHSLSLLILPLRLALPALGEDFYDDVTLQKKYQQGMLRTLMERDGFVVGEIFHLIATLFRSSGEIREEAVQSGFMYSLSSVLRRVICRSYRCGMLPLQEEKDDDSIHAASVMIEASVAPPIYPLPTPVVCGALDIVSACCGGVYKYKKQQHQGRSTLVHHSAINKENNVIPPALFLRRTSDLSLQCLHGFCFQGVLWGASTTGNNSNNNWEAAAAMMKAIACRYCPSKILGTTQNPYGDFLRNHMTVQTLLDMIQWYFVLPSSKNDMMMKKSEIICCGESFATLLLSLLYASLSTDPSTEVGTSRSEHDVQACVATLTSASINCFVSDIILKALHGILAKCTMNAPILHWYSYPDFTAEISFEETMFSSNTLDTSKTSQHHQHREIIANRLARNLYAAEGGSIVLPMLLSRLVNCGAAAALSMISPICRSEKTSNFNDYCTFQGNKLDFFLDWKVQWRRTLLLWLWLLHSPQHTRGNEHLPSSPYGNTALLKENFRRSCALLLACAKTGALKGCVSVELIDRLLPIAPGVGLSDGNENITDSNFRGGGSVSMDRLKLILPIVPTLVCSLLPSYYYPSNNSKSSAVSQIDHDKDSSESWDAALLYKLVNALQFSIQAALKLAFLQLGRRSPTTAGGRPSSTTDFGATQGGWTSLSLNSPSKKVLLFTQRCVEALTKIVLLLQPHAKKPASTKGLDTDGDISSQRKAYFVCHTSSSLNDILAKHPSSVFLEAYEMMQDTLANVLCFVMQNISSGNSGGGGQPSIVIWKSVIGAIPSTDNKCEDERDVRGIHNDDEDRVVFLCSLISITILQLCYLPEGPSNNDCFKSKSAESFSEQKLFSKDVCISLARLAILIQEKNLLQPLTSLPNSLCRSQLILIRHIIHVLKAGREQMGWCQVPVVTHLCPAAKTSISLSSSTTMSSDGAITSKKHNSAMAGSLNVPKVRISSAPLHHTGPHAGLVTLASGFDETSKQYQPFLRPFLNFALQSLAFIPDTCIALWECILQELKVTITAALVGLTFPCARDVGIGTLCAARWALRKVDEVGNVLGQRVCATIILVTAEELRERHINERRIRTDNNEDASHFLVEHMIFGSDPFLAAHDSNKQDEKMGSAKLRAVKTESSLQTQTPDFSIPQQVTRLLDSDGHAINGDSRQQENSHSSNFVRHGDFPSLTDDFIYYTDALTPDSTDLSKVPEIIERSGTSQLSWNSYAGIFSALEKCRVFTHGDSVDFHSNISGDDDNGYFWSRRQSNASDTLDCLRSFLDVWDEHVRRESTFDIVELFEATSLESNEDINQLLNEKPVSDSWDMQNDANIKSSPYANTVAQFIELATGERHRMSESRNVMLTSIVHSSDAAAEHYIYRFRMDAARDEGSVVPDLYEERAIGDSGKDVYSRLSSYPVYRQFPRFVPSYLDHSRAPVSTEDTTSSLQVKSSLSSARKDSSSVQARSYSLGTNSIMEQDILKVAAHVKIVDITKSVSINECEQDIQESVKEEGPIISSLQDNPKSDAEEGDGLHLGFVDRSLFTNQSSAEMDGDSQDMPLVDHSQPGVKASEASSLPFHALKSSQQRELVPFFDSTFNQGGNVPPQVFSATTSFAVPPTSSLGTGLPVECYFDNVLHVRAEGNRKATLLITGLHLILEYDSDVFEGEELAMIEGDRCNDIEGLNKNNKDVVALRPKLTRFATAEISQIFLRRYRLRDSALEIFLVPSGGSEGSAPSVSAFLDFGPGHAGNSRRNAAGTAIMKRAPSQSIKQWPERSSYFVHEHRQRLTSAWVDGRLSNFDYLLHLNTLAGRTFNDLCQYPVMPWVLSNYVSQDIPDLSDRSNFRDMSKPMGALNANRLEDFMERFETFQDPTIPPFMYGSHYSTNAGVVLHFLVRLHPFAGLHRQLQNGHFDVADRLFSSVPRTWEGCTGSSAAEVKELTPEWYCCPTFLRNINHFKLGTSQDGVVIDDVALPPWANNSPERFIEVMRAALESDTCSEMLPDWIDLIFGYKQQGPEAVKAKNVFFYLTYYGSVDVASIEDESLRTATELQIAHFGQCPMKLFWRPHPRKNIDSPKLGFDEFKLYDQSHTKSIQSKTRNSRGRLYPFLNSPPSHVIQLDAPPPKSHAPLIAVRLAGIDRILTVDSQGIFHCFRYSWKAEPSPIKDEVVVLNEEHSYHMDNAFSDNDFDKGCFIAQRELPHFRAVPRLPHITFSKRKRVAVALSKTLFASRTLLLALSDGDGSGGLALQFIDPAKGLVKGETILPCVHGEQVTAIAMDPLGVATGGGAGGELAIVGSADGSASLWRFISSHYLPLRPKQRMRGHNGSAIHAVAISSTLNICATVSSHRCCIFSLGNGVLLCSISPPTNPCPGVIDLSNNHVSTEFSESPAACFSILGYIILVCKSTISQKSIVNTDSDRRQYVDSQLVFTLHLFTIEGVHCGSQSLDSSVPHKIIATFDGRAVLVSRDGGVSVHLVSPTSPMTLISEWVIKEGDGNNVPTLDIDIGPSLFRPVVAAAACSEGTLRLHALPGISAWSEANKKGTMSAVVGSAFAKPAEKLKLAGGIVKGIGTSIVGLGRELGREALSDVKERGVAGFLGGVFGKSTANR